MSPARRKLSKRSEAAAAREKQRKRKVAYMCAAIENDRAARIKPKLTLVRARGDFTFTGTTSPQVDTDVKEAPVEAATAAATEEKEQTLPPPPTAAAELPPPSPPPVSEPARRPKPRRTKSTAAAVQTRPEPDDVAERTHN